MSALALILKERGLIVKGSDIQLSPMTNRLEKQGVEIKCGSAPEFVHQCEGVAFTAAISEDNEDLMLAKKLGKCIYTRSQLLGILSQEKKTISIAGTHGKTTTTGMISTILLETDLDPTVHIGGELKIIKSNLRLGKGDIFVTEACEYKDAFLGLSSYVSVVLNIEEDHLDYFKNYDNILSSFNKFVNNTDKNGLIIYNFDACQRKLDIKERKSLSFGFDNDAQLQAKNIEEFKPGLYSFDAILNKKHVGNFHLSCLGRHNIYNALASIATCLFLGVDINKIKTGLENFQGVARRMEIVNDKKSLIIHDYAHHPQEISASLKALKSFKKDKLVCIFQPHTFSRTQSLWNDFMSCFVDADEVWMLPIYPAREKPIKGITSYAFYKDLKKNKIKSRYFASFNSCFKQIDKLKNNGWTFAILGAGDIDKLASMLK